VGRVRDVKKPRTQNKTVQTAIVNFFFWLIRLIPFWWIRSRFRKVVRELDSVLAGFLHSK
jgi:hypothetical protein